MRVPNYIIKLGATLLLLFSIAFKLKAQTTPQVIIPNFKDKYCEMIKQLEAGQTDIDYKAFRESFIESQQFIIANKKFRVLDSLKKEMYSNMDQKNFPQLIKITKEILSIDYTNMLAHKILRQTYKILNDTGNAAKYKTIQFGLLKSITKYGDGKTCQTAWPVIQIEEEYFILDMLDATLQEQSIDNDGGLCDKMEVKTDKGKKTYYFETTKVFEGYKKLGIK